VFALLVRNQNL